MEPIYTNNYRNNAVLYKVYLKPGLGGPYIVEGVGIDQTTRRHFAARAALAEYRRNTYGPDLTPMTKVIDRIECLDIDAYKKV